MTLSLAAQPVSLNNSTIKAERPLEMGKGSVKIGDQTEQFSYELTGTNNDLVKSIDVNQISGSAKFFADIGTVISNLIRKPATCGAAALAVVASTTETTDAALVYAGANIEAHKALGAANSNDVLWVHSEYQGTTINFSAIRIADYYAIVPAHTVYVPGIGIITPSTAGDGTNYLNNPGLTSTIAEVIVHPSFISSPNFSAQDIAVIRFATPFTGTNPTFGSSITVGETLTSSGFGLTGFVGGTFSQTGDLLGWNASVVSETSGQFNTTYYGNTLFGNGINLNGRVSNGDSGSPVYNSLGQIVGMNVVARNLLLR